MGTHIKHVNINNFILFPFFEKLLKLDPVVVKMIALVSSHTSDFEPQIAEPFPNKRKSTPQA